MSNRFSAGRFLQASSALLCLLIFSYCEGPADEWQRSLLPLLKSTADEAGSREVSRDPYRSDAGAVEIRKSYYVHLAAGAAPPIFSGERWVFENDAGLSERFAQIGVRDFQPAFPGVEDVEALRRVYVMTTSDPAPIASLVEEYPRRFFLIEEVPHVYPLHYPVDFFIPVMLPLTDAQWHLNMINAGRAWDITTGDPNVVIAVLEPQNSFFDTAHEDLVDAFVEIRYFNPHLPGSHYHGSTVAHVASGNTNNLAGIASIGYDTKLLGITYHSHHFALDLMDLPRRGVRILNMSFFFGDYTGKPVRNHTAQLVLETLSDRGMILIGGAGNNDGYEHQPHYPASYANVISVTSVGRDRSHWHPQGGFTHAHNSDVDLSAPGYMVPIIQPGNQYANWGTGTSLAAPIVAGTAALMLSANPCLTPDDVKHLLKSTAAPVYDVPFNASYQGRLGTGIVDAHAAVQAATNYVSANFTPPALNRRFTGELYCDANADWRLRMTGAKNPGLTQHQFNLYNQDTNQLVDVVGQRSSSTDPYRRGPHTFSAILEANSTYFVKRGVWDSCQNWQEHRQYDIQTAAPCIDAETYELSPVYTTSSSGQEIIGGFFLRGSNRYPIERVEFSVQLSATSTPIAFTRITQSLPLYTDYGQSGYPGVARPHSIDARIHFTNGKTRVLHWE